MLRSKQEKIYSGVSYIVLIICSALAVIPFIIMFCASISDNTEIIRNGYNILPRGFSLDAYSYILSNINVIGRAYLVTILTTIAGTVVSLVITAMCAYALAQDDLPLGKAMLFIVLFTMMFNGGLVPTYYVYVRVLHIKNTLFALIMPNLLFGAFNMILIRNYFRSNIPLSLREAARVDGSSEFGTFVKIVLPLSKPILATIGLLTTIGYWNDWQNGLYYVDDSKFYSIQQVLRVMSTNVSSLANMGMSTGVSRNLPTATIRMAIAFIAILPILIAYPFFQSYFVKGIVVGAVKE